MESKCVIIFITLGYFSTVCLHPKVEYKPTEFPYSRCFENGTKKVACEVLNISKEREEKESVWPPGPYAIPMSKYGCPESPSRGWSKSFLKVNMTVINNSSDNNSTVSEQSSSLIGDDYFKSSYRTESSKLYFCVKYRNKPNLDKGQWISGSYNIYKIGSSCPTEFEESNRTLQVNNFVSYGNVPNIAVSDEGPSEKSINISTCKRTNTTFTEDKDTNLTLEMFKTDFILEKDYDTNCTRFDDIATVSQGETHCFYQPKVLNFDYDTAIELILYQTTLSKFHQEIDFEWYFLDCERSLEIVMIDIQASSLQNTYFKCFVNDVPWNLDESPVCNIENGTIPGKIYLRRTRGRFFTFAFKENVIDIILFKVYIASIEAQNGELCFESIEIDNKKIPVKQITASSANASQLPSASKNTLTGWIHDVTDLTPWILVDLIDLTTIEGIGVYFSKNCEMWTSFKLHFGTNKDELQIYNKIDFVIFPPENWWNIDQMFILPTPIKARYIKFSDSIKRQSNTTRCLIFKIYGCKVTRMTDLDSGSVSEMWSLDQELRSAYSSMVRNISAEKCKTICESQNNCSVANINDEKNCHHYMSSQLGIWKRSNINKNDQWFAKLRNKKYLTSFPRAKSKNGSFWGIIRYVATDAIITSVSYPFATILENDIQWIINFETNRFVKIVFTNVSVSECALVVKTKQVGNKGIIIDKRYNDEVFFIETDKNLVYLTTLPDTIWSPTLKFRAIITAEEIPACFSFDSVQHFEKRSEDCYKPKMVLTSFATLNLYQDYEEHFKIRVGEHNSIAVVFIDFYVKCYVQTIGPPFARFKIIDEGITQFFCSLKIPPKIYKSLGSTIDITFGLMFNDLFKLEPYIYGQKEGFRLQYEASDQSLKRYTDNEGSELSVCSLAFRKCYKVFSAKRSWDSANSECNDRNEHLVTITSRREMNYIQYLLRDQLYQRKMTRKSGDDSLFSAHIGLKRIHEKQRLTTTFTWINSYNVTYNAWGVNQPSDGDCIRTLFEHFNTENLWETEDCFSDIVDFFICEAPYSKNRKHSGRNNVECKSVESDKNSKMFPLSGRTCQNWKNMSHEAKEEFDEKFSHLKRNLKNSTRCEDLALQDIPWCYVNDPGSHLREPCFLHHKSDTAKVKSPDVYKCEDGASIPKLNLCDKTFDCVDLSDELSCQNGPKDHNLTSDESVSQSNIPSRLKAGSYFRCERSKEWISMLAKCDDTIDCHDASDEVGCLQSDNVCDETGFLCDGGNCIKISQVCDLRDDCEDGTDEYCDYHKCDENEFRCDNKQCIPLDSRCNAIPDCSDNSDEVNCDSCIKSYHCADDFKCIPNRLKCDQYPDCKNGRDENSCNIVRPPTFNDLSGEYISTEFVYRVQDFRSDLNWDFTLKGKDVGRITVTADTNIPPNSFNTEYFCFRPMLIDCLTQFREAAVIDNYNSNFAYPLCECEIYQIPHCNCYIDSWMRRCGEDENVRRQVIDNSTLDTYRVAPQYYRQYRPFSCSYEYNASTFGEFFYCERDKKAIPKSMLCVYSIDASGYMRGCRSGNHLQNCDNFTCPENTVKCPGSYCIEQRFVCDGHIECPGGEDEQNCSCTDSDREVILFVDDDDSIGKEAARNLAQQFFTSVEKSIVRLFYYTRLHRQLTFDITYRLLEIREERLPQNYDREPQCKYKTLARDFMKKLKFGKPETSGIVVIQSSDESSVVANLTLSNLSEPAFSIFRVIKDFNSSLYKKDQYKFVKDIHISKWSSLFSIGYRRFPEICTEASHIPCAGKFRCSSSKQCIPLEQLCDNVTHCRNGDDERLCHSNCPQNCSCIGDFVNCSAANIFLKDISSLTIQARSADLSKNPLIKKIEKHQLNYPYLIRLDISSCEIDDIDKKAFFGLKNLLSLDLSNNKIKLLPKNVFSKLRFLTFLNLDRNFDLAKIESTAFQGLKAVKSLRISGTNLKKISSFTFSGLKLDYIDISNNQIEEIEKYAFNNTEVNRINFEGNKVVKFSQYIFNDVTSLQELRTPAFKFCCIRPCYVAEENCKPLKNEFSSCEDLMRHSVLQAVLWIVGIASLCGNFSSIIYRLVYDRERLKIGYGIFVTNLAAADFLMGVYLIMIAVADSLYRNGYIFMDEQWRNSNWCNIAGVLSTISSEASVFFLCLITLDRLLVIKFPFGRVRFGPMKARLSCGICWLISITLSVIPILYTSHFQNKFYSKTGVCIALPLTRDKPPGWIYSVSIFVGLNFCTFILVAVGQISIFTELRRSSSSIKKTQISRKRDLKVARNLILVATTDFLCWFPIGVMGILALNGFAIPGDVYAWSAVFILPINSALNPFLYTVSAIVGKKSFNPSLDEQSRTMVQKEIGSAILEHEELRKTVRIKREPLRTGKMRSIQEILNDDRSLSVSFVVAVFQKLADYLRFFHESSLQLDKITEANIYIKTKKNKAIVVINAIPSIAVDERVPQENIRQFGILLRKLIAKCEKEL